MEGSTGLRITMDAYAALLEIKGVLTRIIERPVTFSDVILHLVEAYQAQKEEE